MFPFGLALALLWKGRRKPDPLFMAVLWTLAEIRATIDFQSGFYGYAIVGIAAVTAACLPGLFRLLKR